MTWSDGAAAWVWAVAGLLCSRKSRTPARLGEYTITPAIAVLIAIAAPMDDLRKFDLMCFPLTARGNSKPSGRPVDGQITQNIGNSMPVRIRHVWLPQDFPPDIFREC